MGINFHVGRIRLLGFYLELFYAWEMEQKKVEQSKISLFIRDLCRGRSEEELKEAEQNFRDYLLVVKEICDRLEREGITIQSFDD